MKLNIEEDYPIDFDMEYFKSLKDFRDGYRYCKSKLEEINKGSSRAVFYIDEEKCLKLAINEAGISQNKVESDSFFKNSGITAPVYDYDKNHYWLEMGLARKAKFNDFKRILGIHFDTINIFFNIHDIWGDDLSQLSSSNRKVYDMYYNRIMKVDFFNKIITEFINDYTLIPGDFGKMDTYGIFEIRGKDVIRLIDYGLTEKTYHDYYD
jgi:hypothetical protein